MLLAPTICIQFSINCYQLSIECLSKNNSLGNKQKMKISLLEAKNGGLLFHYSSTCCYGSFLKSLVLLILYC